MVTGRVFVVGSILAIMAVAGCSTGTARVGTEPAASGATEGLRPSTGGSHRCDGGTYNQAAGLCVYGGG